MADHGKHMMPNGKMMDDKDMMQMMVSKKMKKMMGEYKSSGKIGNASPKNIAKARKQALAIAYKKVGEK